MCLVLEAGIGQLQVQGVGLNLLGFGVSASAVGIFEIITEAAGLVGELPAQADNIAILQLVSILAVVVLHDAPHRVRVARRHRGKENALLVAVDGHHQVDRGIFFVPHYSATNDAHTGVVADLQLPHRNQRNARESVSGSYAFSSGDFNCPNNSAPLSIILCAYASVSSQGSD
jgi:hypothetical protein